MKITPQRKTPISLVAPGTAFWVNKALYIKTPQIIYGRVDATKATNAVDLTTGGHVFFDNDLEVKIARVAIVEN